MPEIPVMHDHIVKPFRAPVKTSSGNNKKWCGRYKGQYGPENGKESEQESATDEDKTDKTAPGFSRAL